MIIQLIVIYWHSTFIIFICKNYTIKSLTHKIINQNIYKWCTVYWSKTLWYIFSNLSKSCTLTPAKNQDIDVGTSYFRQRKPIKNIDMTSKLLTSMAYIAFSICSGDQSSISSSSRSPELGS